MDYYRLTDDGRVERSDRACYDNFRIGDDTIGESRVSTVFLAIDHNHARRGAPIVFETMVFGGPLDGDQWRYCTLDEAKEGHAEAVTKVKAAQDGPADSDPPWAEGRTDNN